MYFQVDLRIVWKVYQSLGSYAVFVLSSEDEAGVLEGVVLVIEEGMRGNGKKGSLGRTYHPWTRF